jgi:hypothetical protein
LRVGLGVDPIQDGGHLILDCRPHPLGQFDPLFPVTVVLPWPWRIVQAGMYGGLQALAFRHGLDEFGVLLALLLLVGLLLLALLLAGVFQAFEPCRLLLLAFSDGLDEVFVLLALLLDPFHQGLLLLALLVWAEGWLSVACNAAFTVALSAFTAACNVAEGLGGVDALADQLGGLVEQRPRLFGPLTVMAVMPFSLSRPA